MDRRADAGLIIILALFLIIVAVGTIIFIYSKPEPVVENVSINSSFFNLYVASNALSKVNYVLSNGSMAYVQGVLYPGIIEEFKGVLENSSVILIAWSDEYYFNSSNCSVVVNNSHCVVGVDRKALEYKVSVSNNFVNIYDIRGVVKEPFLCFSWRTNVADIVSPYPEIKVPDDYHSFFDKCFSLPSLTNDVLVPIDVHYNFAYNSSMPLNVFVLDHERSGYAGIGLRNASVVL